MKKLFFLITIFAFALSAADINGIFKRTETTAGIVAPQGKNGCSVQISSGAATAVFPVKFNAHAQHILLFVLRGDSVTCDAQVEVEIKVNQRIGVNVYRSKPIAVKGIETRTEKLEISTGFGLGDAFYNVEELRFIVTGKSGSKLYISGIRCGNRDELTGSGDGIRVYSAYKAPAKRVIPGLAPRKVYFELDNNDLDQHIYRWRAREMAPDPNHSGGFRQLLLDNADGIVELAATPEEADVVVISCARKRDMSKLVKLAKAGKTTLLYGVVVNRELDEISPISAKELKISGLAGRDTLAKAVEHPAFAAAPLLDADYGIYYDTELRSGTPLLKYSNGKVAAAVNKNVIQFVTGLGTHIQKPGSVFYDPFFLRTVCSDSKEHLAALAVRERNTLLERESSRTSLVKALLGKGADVKDWRKGMSEGNVGRFGWLISEGLLIGDIGRDLGVNNADQYYRFTPMTTNRISLPQWGHKVVSGNIKIGRSTPENTDPTESWGGEGTVEYFSTFTLPDSWGRDGLFFNVDLGIDDIDEAFVNGKKIGATGTDVNSYWMVPRKYAIPKEVLKDGVNSLTVRVTNLKERGCFKSRPYISLDSKEKKSVGKLTVMRADWVGKHYKVEDTDVPQELWFSLLSPFTLHKFEQNVVALSLEEKSVQYAAIPLAGGIKIVDLRKVKDLYDLRRDGKLAEPWVLLFRENWSNARPLALVFSDNPGKITAQVSNGFVASLALNASGKALGYIACGWPFGVKPADAKKWVNGLPGPAVAQMRKMVPLALNYPVGLDEIYRVDRAGNKVDIVNRFRYMDVSGNWKLKNKKYAFIPPLAGFMLKRKDYISTTEKLVDFNCNTDYGPLMGKFGTDTVGYSITMPLDTDFVPVNVKADAELHKELDSYVENGLRWSRGGRVPCEEFTFAWPAGEKKNPHSSTLSFYTWNYGFSTSFQGYFFLSERIQNKLYDRLRRRYNMPLELYQYKSALLHRLEPFSGLKYPILFDHNHENSTNYASGIGSRVIFGDANEGCTMVSWIGDVQANMFHHTGVVKCAWSFIRYAMRYETVIDDYAFHASTCREFGQGSFIDMLNGEYAAFISFARLARVNGDRETEDDALYRAAKRGIPTLARLFYLDYIAENMPNIDLNGVAVCTGFSEDRQNIFRLPSRSHNFLCGNEIFDLAQGFPGTLLRLYERHSQEEISRYLNEKSLPEFLKHDIMNAGYLPPVYIYADPATNLDKLFANTLRRSKKMKSDWPGMRMSYQMGIKLWREYGRVSISEFEDVNIRKADLDPATSTLELVCAAGKNGRLAISSPTKVLSVRHNGKEISFKQLKSYVALPLVAGDNRFEIVFGKLALPEVKTAAKKSAKRAVSGEKAQLIWKEDFSGNIVKKYGAGEVVSTPEGKALKVSDKLAGCWLTVPENETLRITADIKMENVQRLEPKKHWTGGRFASFMPIKAKKNRHGATLRTGTSDWQTYTFKVDVPAGNKRLLLQLGLKDATGVMMFRNIKVEVVK